MMYRRPLISYNPLTIPLNPQLNYNAEAVLELPKYDALRNKFPEINIAIETLKLIHKLENGVPPSEIISDVDDTAGEIAGKFPQASGTFKNILTTIHFTRIFSESLRSIDNSSIWISIEETKMLVTNETFGRIYLGLLWEKIHSDTTGLKYFLDKKILVPLLALINY